MTQKHFKLNFNNAVHIRIFDKQTWLWWFGFSLELSFTTAPVALKIQLGSKVVKSESEITIKFCSI